MLVVTRIKKKSSWDNVTSGVAQTATNLIFQSFLSTLIISLKLPKTMIKF